MATETRHEKITKRLIDSLQPRLDGDLFIIDTETQGFGYRLKPSGSGHYFVKYFSFDGPKRRDARYKIAGSNAAPEEARKKAKADLAKIALGNDPSAEKKAGRKALTVSSLCDEYLVAARAGLVLTRFGKSKSASTIAIDEGRISRHIKPLIGDIVAEKLTRASVQRLFDAIASGETATTVKTKKRGVARVTGGKATAGRVVELLGGIWSWAERRELVTGTNPVRGVTKYKPDARDRHLSYEELARLGKAMREECVRRPAAVAALRLITLTGMRREEACGLRWCEFDAENRCLRLEHTKTGKSIRPVGSSAYELLKSLSKNGDYVFPAQRSNDATREATGSSDLKKALGALFAAAGIDDASPHDMRRTFASVAADEGYDDNTIRALLGQSRKGVTEKHYIRRSPAALVAVADRVASRILIALDSGDDENIIQLTKAGH
jgi:integrase